MHKIDIKLLDGKYKGLKKVNKLNLAAIDIGSPATDRASSNGLGTYTHIIAENPANASGTITSVEIWFNVGVGALEGLWVATFYNVSGNNFSTRDTVSLGEASAGYNAFEVGLNVEGGDYIGIFAGGGRIDTTWSGDGAWYLAGNQIPCTNVTFAFEAGFTFSLYGIGTTGNGVEEDNAIFFGFAF